MDANIASGSPGLPSGNRQLCSQDGATPARSMDGSALDNALPSAAALAVPAARAGTEERRRSPRFECPGSVEISIDGSDVPLSGTLTNISLHGCYVKTPTTFPLDTGVSIAIASLTPASAFRPRSGLPIHQLEWACAFPKWIRSNMCSWGCCCRPSGQQNTLNRPTNAIDRRSQPPSGSVPVRYSRAGASHFLYISSGIMRAYGQIPGDWCRRFHWFLVGTGAACAR